MDRKLEKTDEAKRENRLERMRELTATLSKAARVYYQESGEIMSNLEYDRLYDELLALEKETGVVLSGVPPRRWGMKS